jgi:superfamily II DNA or RNA helicase
MQAVDLHVTPQGVLVLGPDAEAVPLDDELAERLTLAFARGAGHGLLQLGTGEIATILPPVLVYWREFAARFVTALCLRAPRADDRQALKVPAPEESELERCAIAAPSMLGAEYLNADRLVAIWQALNVALEVELHETTLSLPAFLKSRHAAWNVVGRVHFNLAENRNDSEAPFAFLATYTTSLSANARAQHLPLGQALKEFAGAAKREQLLSLLTPVQAAAESCAWLRQMTDKGEIYHPLRWRPADAMAFLRDVPLLERAGIIVRMPSNWRMNRPARPQVRASLGNAAPGTVGLDALLDFKMEVTLEGERLSRADIDRLLKQTESLVFIRGQWVEIDRDRLQRTLDQFQAVERAAKQDGLGFIEAMRLLTGAQVANSDDELSNTAWSEVVAGPWLAETLKQLRAPDKSPGLDPGSSLQGTLRPYQRSGVQWLHLLTSLRLGACLADDMGLGKTIQILALLLVSKQQARGTRKASLLVAPASLLANWSAEIERFAPSLKAFIAHPSAVPAAELKSLAAQRLAAVDLVVTTYSMLERVPWLLNTPWRFVILDEAQAIKNPGSKQTKAARRIQAEARIALTGTPIENRLGDLWSLFDFINPGLLGTAKQFSGYVKRLGEQASTGYAPLRELVRPYILRRLKTDKRIIADLPDKTELKTYCALSRNQIALYEQAVNAIKAQLLSAEGIQRRGLVLALLVRLKQICNHPSHWLADDAWHEQDSGKFGRLRELIETIAAKQEKLLIFTQFREITEPLANYVGTLFGRAGLVLHGDTPIKQRKELVRRFQEDEHVPFFLLSLKAGGTGLNLTAAAHVIHFDRWWNPAVENQATDRAFRIGQTKNVLVHKFICRGTVEDKIDQMITAKQQLAGEFLETGAELNLTELRDDELLRLISLDLDAAIRET